MEQRWARVKALFHAAVERPAAERDAFLAAATGGDDALRREVESLLTSDTPDVSLFDRLPIVTDSAFAEAAPALLALDRDRSFPSALTAGVRWGPYEIVAMLGAGAMGEVYRARDSKLPREVALKVLPARFALDPDRLARFSREAQLLGTLNHSNIAALYGIEEANGAQALVLELVDGPTLAERIAVAPMALSEALPIARQMAEALEAAHDKGIIHRDIKPANVKIASDGTAKVLDFGLAKVWDGAPNADLSGSPRLTASHLDGRPILGTPTYMSPEQARGKPLDRRTDLWSFGCVLYEMLSGRAAFAGETISDTLAAVLEREADFTALPADTPLPIRRLLRRCLVRDRRGRLDSAAAARLEIDDAIASGIVDPPPLGIVTSPRATRVAIAALAAGLAIGASVTAALWQAPSASRPPTRFAIVTPPAQPLNISSADRDVALSPDGRHLVYLAGGSVSAGGQLMVRSTGDLNARPVAGHHQCVRPVLFARWPVAGVLRSGRAQEGRDHGWAGDHARNIQRRAARCELGRGRHDRVRYRRPCDWPVARFRERRPSDGADRHRGD